MTQSSAVLKGVGPNGSDMLVSAVLDANGERLFTFNVFTATIEPSRLSDEEQAEALTISRAIRATMTPKRIACGGD